MREMCFKAQLKTVKCRRARYLMYDTPAGCKGLPIKHHTVLITLIFLSTQECFHFIIRINILFVQLFPSSSFIPAFAFLFGRSYFITGGKIWFVTVHFCSRGFYQFTKRFVNLWYQTVYFSLLYCKENGSAILNGSLISLIGLLQIVLKILLR